MRATIEGSLSSLLEATNDVSNSVWSNPKHLDLITKLRQRRITWTETTDRFVVVVVVVVIFEN